MTIKELNDMTDDQLRIKLAELLGWKIGRRKFKMAHGWRTGVRWEHPTNHFVAAMGLYGNGYSTKPMIYALPNYPGCLNACHEAEKDAELNFQIYLRRLWDLVNPCYAAEPACTIVNYLMRAFVCATARQRTIALILTLQPAEKS